MQKRRLLPLACALLLTGRGAASAPSGAVPSAPQRPPKAQSKR